jgi:hypothetical protein
MELDFSGHIFKKILKYQIEWKPDQYSMRIDGQTDGRTEMTKQIVTFCNFVKAPKKNKKYAMQLNLASGN